MAKYNHIDDIRDAYNHGVYTFKPEKPIPKTVSNDHVFDENLSVKQNREMVAEHNKMVANMTREYRNKDHAMFNQLREDVTEYISTVYDMSMAQAHIIESYVYTEKHAFIGDYFSAIDEIAEMVEDVLRTK